MDIGIGLINIIIIFHILKSPDSPYLVLLPSNILIFLHFLKKLMFKGNLYNSDEKVY